MQLPKYPPLELLYTDPSRANGAYFTFNDDLFVLTGLNINDDAYDLDDVDRIPPGATLEPIARRYLGGGAWSDEPEVIDSPDAIEELCNFHPPASMFRPTDWGGRFSVLRRSRSYTPFVTRSSIRMYIPTLRGWNNMLSWSESTVSPAVMAAAVSGELPERALIDTRLYGLTLGGVSCLLDDNKTVLVGTDSSYIVGVYADPNCRVRVGLIPRDPHRNVLNINKGSDMDKLLSPIVPEKYINYVE